MKKNFATAVTLTIGAMMLSNPANAATFTFENAVSVITCFDNTINVTPYCDFNPGDVLDFSIITTPANDTAIPGTIYSGGAFPGFNWGDVTVSYTDGTNTFTDSATLQAFSNSTSFALQKGSTVAFGTDADLLTVDLSSLSADELLTYTATGKNTEFEGMTYGDLNTGLSVSLFSKQNSVSSTSAAVPLPATLPLALAGVAALGAIRRRKALTI